MRNPYSPSILHIRKFPHSQLLPRSEFIPSTVVGHLPVLGLLVRRPQSASTLRIVRTCGSMADLAQKAFDTIENWTSGIAGKIVAWMTPRHCSFILGACVAQRDDVADTTRWRAALSM
jgi:hypothetical protein